MMRSLFSGVAGLKTHQTRMDVIGNNIANVNTTAFKSSNMVFSELMSQTTQKATGANATTGLGGVNARQIGLGVKGGAININITGQGANQSTGNPLDLMITGDNFFVVNTGTGNAFTRDGSFYVDGAGNLAMTSTGYNVMGWQVDEETMNIKKDTVSALRIMSAANMTYPPEATSKAYMAGIIDKNDTDVTSSNGLSRNLNFYDALGYSYTARIVFKQNGNIENGKPAGYSVEVTRLLDAKGQEIDISGMTFGNEVAQPKNTDLKLDTSVYSWNTASQKYTPKGGTAKVTAAPGTLLIGKDDKGKDLFLFDIKSLIDKLSESFTATPKKADWSKRKEVFPVGDNEKATVQDALDELAKAYGYEGKTEEFLKLYKEFDKTGSTDKDKVSVMEMLENLATDTWTEATKAAPEGKFGKNSFPTLTSTWVESQDAAGKDTSKADTKAGASISMNGRYYTGDSIWFDGKSGKFSGMGANASGRNFAKVNFAALGENFSEIEIDFSELAMFDNKGTSTAQATSGDFDGIGMGRRPGEMNGVSIQQDGQIYASYDNGMTKLLGQIATANFANASGLEKSGDNLYLATQNSGEFDGIGVDITSSGGKMASGQLEMSNVDLSAEFTTMITTQRGFQANSRIITVSDTLLEELTNLKR